MAPTPADAAMVERDEDADGQHSCCSFGLLVMLVDESAEAGIFVVDEISFVLSLLSMTDP
jgi:hypothetical protein